MRISDWSADVCSSDLNGGKDPKYQALGVHILFVALLIVVVGSYAGTFFAIAQVMPPELNFWFGHQGYEYLDLGRFWQIVLFIVILFWLLLMLRAMISEMRGGGAMNLLALLCMSVVAIGLFYGFGLFSGQLTHNTTLEILC